MLDEDFWAFRTCFLAAIPELDEAAGLLGQAADCVLAGDFEAARGLLARADMPAVRAHAARLMGKTDPEVHRFRAVAAGEGASAVVKAGQRMPSPAEQMEIFRRDGFRCRFCGCRVVLGKARAALAAAVPGAVAWGAADADKHAAFYALTAVADHVVPHTHGGNNSADNLVTTCQGCNYGRNRWLLAEVGLIDPFARSPVCDAWDGLSRLLDLAVPTAAKREVPKMPEKTRAVRAKNGVGAARRAEAAAAWYDEVGRLGGHSLSRLVAVLDECADLGVSYHVDGLMIVRMTVGDTRLAVLGIERGGDVQIPWDIGPHKASFRRFAVTLAGPISGAEVYETDKMWRVRMDGRRVRIGELADASGALRAAFEALHDALMLSAVAISASDS